LLAFGAERPFFRVHGTREEIENHVAFLAIKLIYWHGSSFLKTMVN
jgi:hypothetical protein